MKLFKSKTGLVMTYSGVMIQKTKKGYRISGYDKAYPYFYIRKPYVFGKNGRDTECDLIFDSVGEKAARYLISSSNGNGNNTEPLVLIENADDTIINRFFYKSSRIIKGGIDTPGPHSRDVEQTIEIIEEDKEAKIELVHLFSIFKNFYSFVR